MVQLSCSLLASVGQLRHLELSVVDRGLAAASSDSAVGTASAAGFVR